MKRFLLFVFVFLFECTCFLRTNAQTPDWSTSIASIIYNNCSSCHHEGAIAPFPLMAYSDALANSQGIKNMVVAKKMPPWPADPDYRHFANEAILSDDEITSIQQWVDGGSVSGNLSQAPLPPVYATGGSQMPVIDDYIQIESYTIQYNTDEYRYYVIPSGFTDTMYINQIEVIAGNPALVHHADIYYDVSGESALLDQQDPLPGFNSNTGSPYVDYYMNAWQPGGNIAKYPGNWGIMVPPGADFVLEIHYGPGGQGTIDSTRMNFKFVNNPQEVRAVSVQWLLYDGAPCLLDGPLTIPAYAVKSFHQRSVVMSKDRSFISICPHMHHIGVSYRVWFETSDGDSVPLIDIPAWNFYWQKYYTFQKIQKIPQGARIYSEAVYDNTLNNPDNPNNPPLTVSRGATTADEMLDCYFIFGDYEPGDEDIVLDSSLFSSSFFSYSASPFNIYPNPVNDHFHLEGETDDPSGFSIKLYNSMGLLVNEKSFTNKIGKFSERIDMEQYSPGMYFLEISSQKHQVLQKILKQ